MKLIDEKVDLMTVDDSLIFILYILFMYGWLKVLMTDGWMCAQMDNECQLLSCYHIFWGTPGTFLEFEIAKLILNWFTMWQECQLLLCTKLKNNHNIFSKDWKMDKESPKF